MPTATCGWGVRVGGGVSMRCFSLEADTRPVVTGGALHLLQAARQEPHRGRCGSAGRRRAAALQCCATLLHNPAGALCWGTHHVSQGLARGAQPLAAAHTICWG